MKPAPREVFSLRDTEAEVFEAQIAGQSHRAIRMRHRLVKAAAKTEHWTEWFIMSLETATDLARRIDETVARAAAVQPPPTGVQ